ncbi:MAG TPA: LPS export ABC transporter periplasmic protein LptC [Dongiaceae bacterium]|nr:LPS export ABC transporter periplasmic protein LptC [Dongiaceae bacterium]
MKQSIQATLSSLLLGLMIVALLSYSGWDEWFESEPTQPGEEAQPDLIALKVEQVSFDEQGNKQYLLHAERMLQFLEANENHMFRPDVLIFREQTPAWKTTADEARSDATGEELLLEGNVTIVQQGVERAATMETPTLTLYPRTSQASTKDKVVIRQPGIYIEAMGLDADLNTNKLTLKRQVTSIYEPAKS